MCSSNCQYVSNETKFLNLLWCRNAYRLIKILPSYRKNWHQTLLFSFNSRLEQKHLEQDKLFPLCIKSIFTNLNPGSGSGSSFYHVGLSFLPKHNSCRLEADHSSQTTSSQRTSLMRILYCQNKQTFVWRQGKHEFRPSVTCQSQWSAAGGQN